MTPERWAQVKQAFQAALELAPEERAIYRDGFCIAEPELRKAVKSLLHHHHKAGTVMDHPAGCGCFNIASQSAILSATGLGPAE